MEVYIKRTIDYTLKRKGEKMYSICDVKTEQIVPNSCFWKTKKACMNRLLELGHEYIGQKTVHQNYAHWADFEFAK